MGATLVYSTSNYKKRVKKEYPVIHTPTGIIKSNRSARDENHPLYAYKKAAKVIKEIAMLMD